MFWTSKAKIGDMFSQAYHQKNLIPTVKHSAGNVMVWGCFAASGPGAPQDSLRILHCTRGCSRLMWNSVSEDWSSIKSGHCENDPEHSNKSTKKSLKKREKKCRVLEWPSQSQDLSPIKMLWANFKRAVNALNPSNIIQLKKNLLCDREKTPIRDCKKSLQAVLGLQLTI